MLNITIAIILITTFIFLALFFQTKSLEEKLMYVSSITNMAIILITIFSLTPNRESFLDIAYILCLFSFITNFVMLKFRSNPND
jgi:multisubunit Na+/H+ antiporter MnhF subunit